MANRRSWRAQFLSPERWPATGFVYRDDDGKYTSWFLKPYPRTRPPEKEDWVFIGNHHKLLPARKAVDAFARRNEFERSSRWA